MEPPCGIPGLPVLTYIDARRTIAANTPLGSLGKTRLHVEEGGNVCLGVVFPVMECLASFQAFTASKVNQANARLLGNGAALIMLCMHLHVNDKIRR